MQLTRPFLLLLLLPGLLFGAGFDLRLCAHEFLGAEGCCSREPDCCAERRPSREPSAESVNPCAACCVDIAIPAEQSLPSPERPGQELTRAQATARIVSVEALAPIPAELIVLAPSHVPSDPPGRRTPLPLRI